VAFGTVLVVCSSVQQATCAEVERDSPSHRGGGIRQGGVTVDDQSWLADRFEAHRPHLRAVAYRMLGSPTEADDAVLHADEATVRMGAEALVTGAGDVAATFSGRARGARLATVDGEPGLVWSTGGRPRVVFTFVIAGDRIAEIAMHSDPATLADLEIAP
jgi:hypothetical protein